MRAVPLAVSVLHGLLLQVDNMCSASGCYSWHVLQVQVQYVCRAYGSSVLHGLRLQVDNMCSAYGCYSWHVLLVQVHHACRALGSKCFAWPAVAGGQHVLCLWLLFMACLLCLWRLVFCMACCCMWIIACSASDCSLFAYPAGARTYVCLVLAVSVLHGLLLQVDNCMLCRWLLIHLLLWRVYDVCPASGR